MGAIMTNHTDTFSGDAPALDAIICGNGIAGVSIAYHLEKHGKKYLVINNPELPCASKVSAGIVNPITGKYFTLSWKFPELRHEALAFYSSIFDFLGIDWEPDIHLVRALNNAGNINDWEGKATDRLYGSYMNPDCNPDVFASIGSRVQGEGKVLQAMQIPLSRLITNWTGFLREKERLLEEPFDFGALEWTDNKVHYKSVSAENIIFCEGFSVMKNPLFNYLPLNPAKGEALLVKMEGLPPKTIIKDGVFIAPWKPDENIFWIGSTYSWHDLSIQTTDEKRFFLEDQLKKMLSDHVTVIDQLAGIRPAVKDRRPLVGRHPVYRSAYILNGLGTKGTSLAPMFSKQLYNLIYNQISPDKEVDIERFSALYPKNIQS